MPKFHPTPIIQDCWSSIGNITFYHRNGQCFYKRKIKPVFPGTPAQLDQAQVHHRAILAWQQLAHSVQLQWRELATSTPKRWHISARIQLAAPGVGCDPSKMRTYIQIM